MNNNRSTADGDSFDVSFSLDITSSQAGLFKQTDVNSTEVERTYELDDERNNTLVSNDSGRHFLDGLLRVNIFVYSAPAP